MRPMIGNQTLTFQKSWYWVTLILSLTLWITYRQYLYSKLSQLTCRSIYNGTISELIIPPSPPTSGSRKWDLHLPHCKIRRLEPNHISIRKYINVSLRRLDCGSLPALTSLREGVLRMDRYVLEKYYKVNVTRCRYRSIQRNYKSSNPDDHLTYGKDERLSNRTKVVHDFVQVSCYGKNRSKIYDNIHANGYIDPSFASVNGTPEFLKRTLSHHPNHVINRSSRIPKAKVKKSQKVSVLMIGIDSTSRLNFVRGLPKTHGYLKSRRPEGILFKGYIKVGDNTFPNLIPLLTGKLLGEYGENFGRDHYFDNYSFVWDTYRSAGYATAFLEDSAELATFNYLRKGFYHPPTHFYYRPYSIKARWMDGGSHCNGNKHEVRALLDYSRNLVTSLAPVWPYFILTYTTRLTHDYLNNIKHLDGMLLDYFARLMDSGKLDDTLIVLFGDHGMRYGNFRKTYIGMMEERLPLLYILPPNWYMRRYPEMAANLKTNSHRIATPLDLYATLNHIISIENGENTSLKKDFNHSRNRHKSFSLFERIPLNRSCSTARIPIHYCPCNLIGGVTDIAKDKSIKVCALAMVDKLNVILKPYIDICRNLKFGKVRDAKIFAMDEADDPEINLNPNPKIGDERPIYNQTLINNLTEIHSLPRRILLTIMVQPSKAIFEASFLLITYPVVSHEMTGDISRLNKYGNQSHCVNDTEIRKYCYCKTILIKKYKS